MAGRLPGSLGADIALVLTVHPTEAGPHTLSVVLQGADGQQVARLDAQFVVPGPLMPRPPELPAELFAQPGEMIVVPLAISLQMVAIPGSGRYSLEILVDGDHKKTLAFLVTPTPHGTAQATPRSDPTGIKRVSVAQTMMCRGRHRPAAGRSLILCK